MAPSLRLREHRALLDALDRLYQSVSPAEFPGLLFAVLSGLLPDTLHSFDALELATGRMESHITPVTTSLLPVAQIESAVRAFIWQNPGMDELTRRPQDTFQLDDLTSSVRFRRTDFYQHCSRPLSIRHQLVAGIARSGHTAAFTVNRGGARPFSAREMELIARLRPHVERAFALALRNEEVRQKNGGGRRGQVAGRPVDRARGGSAALAGRRQAQRGDRGDPGHQRAHGGETRRALAGQAGRGDAHGGGGVLRAARGKFAVKYVELRIYERVRTGHK